MFIFFLQSFMLMLLSDIYMPNTPEKCHNYFKSQEFHSALERLFPKSYLKLEENTWKNSSKRAN